MIEDGISVAKSRRPDHQRHGVRGHYSHVTKSMVDMLPHRTQRQRNRCDEINERTIAHLKC